MSIIHGKNPADSRLPGKTRNRVLNARQTEAGRVQTSRHGLLPLAHRVHIGNTDLAPRSPLPIRTRSDASDLPAIQPFLALVGDFGARRLVDRGRIPAALYRRLAAIVLGLDLQRVTGVLAAQRIADLDQEGVTGVLLRRWRAPSRSPEFGTAVRIDVGLQKLRN